MQKKLSLNDNLQEISNTIDTLKINRNLIISEIEKNEVKKENVLKNLRNLKINFCEIKGNNIFNPARKYSRKIN